MENNVLIKEQQAQGAESILKVTALLYLKEALLAQQYESCPGLIDAAKDLGVSQGEITDLISDHLKARSPGRREANRLS